MICADVRERSSDYCDGELSAFERREIERHLQACEACRDELAGEREVVRLAAAWRRDIEPEHDLWPAIEARVVSRRGRLLRGPWTRVERATVAAAAALVAALTVVLVRQPGPPEPSVATAPGAAAGVAAEAIVDPASAGRAPLVLASERALVDGGLMHVREDLLRAISERRDRLDPETRAMVDRNLRIIDRALGEIYQALEADPDNRVLEQLLADTYQHEAEFLKQVNTL
jgi:hypothetical protein